MSTIPSLGEHDRAHSAEAPFPTETPAFTTRRRWPRATRSATPTRGRTGHDASLHVTPMLCARDVERRHRRRRRRIMRRHGCGFRRRHQHLSITRLPSYASSSSSPTARSTTIDAGSLSPSITRQPSYYSSSGRSPRSTWRAQRGVRRHKPSSTGRDAYFNFVTGGRPLEANH